MHLPLLVLCLLVGQSLLAEDGIFCAALLPCNPDGTVLLEYANGPCEMVYKEQCLSLYKSELEDSLGECKLDLDKTNEEKERLKKTIKRLRAQARTAKLK